MVKFVYFGLICCSVANGFVWYSKEIPNAYVLLVLLICVFLVILHRHHTRKWCKDGNERNYNNDEENRSNYEERDYYEDHPCVFVVSFVVALIFLLVSCLFLLLVLCLSIPSCGIVSCVIASLTAAIFFLVAARREVRYSEWFGA